MPYVIFILINDKICFRKSHEYYAMVVGISVYRCCKSTFFGNYCLIFLLRASCFAYHDATRQNRRLE